MNRVARLLPVFPLVFVFGSALEGLRVQASPSIAPLPPQPLDRTEALVYVVRSGETLSQISVDCEIEGGASTLAAWNEIQNPDVLGRDDRLLVPRGTQCERALLEGAWPSVDWDYEACVLDWRELDELHNDSRFASLNYDGLDALGEAEYSEWMEGKYGCAEPLAGLEICGRHYGVPRLTTTWQGELTWADPRTYGQGGRGGALPMYAVVDLDGDGDDEVVLDQFEDWSLGISMPYTSLRVLEDGSSQLVTVDATYFRRDEHFVRNDVGGCDLIRVGRARLDDPVSKEGNYLAAGRLRWTGDDFEPLPALPMAARRMTRSFLRELGEDTVTQLMLGPGAEARF